MSCNQFPQPQTQASTYTSSSTTIATQQQTTTSSTHHDQQYIPTYQNPAPQASQCFDQSQFSQTQQLQPPASLPQTVSQQPLYPIPQNASTQLVSANTTVHQSQFSQYQQLPQEYHQTMPQMYPAPQSIPARLTGTDVAPHQSSSDFQQSIQPAFRPPAVDYMSNQPQPVQYQQPFSSLSQTLATSQQLLPTAPSTQLIGGGGPTQQVSVGVPQLAPPTANPPVGSPEQPKKPKPPKHPKQPKQPVPTTPSNDFSQQVDRKSVV